MTAIADFSEAEIWVIKSTLRERYGHDVEVELAATELRLDPASTQLAECPAVYWFYNGCNFIIVKTGDERYRAQFFYRVHQQYGTGIEEFDNLSDCTVTLLQVQADFDASERAQDEKG